MPVASGVVWCEPGSVLGVADRLPQIAGTEVQAREGDALVAVVTASDRRGVDSAFAAWSELPGVSWVDATYYTEADLEEDGDEEESAGEGGAGNPGGS